MVLDHVTQRARALVIACALLQPDRLGDRDLDVVDPLRVPYGLEERVAEAQREDVLDGFLAEVMIDPVGPVFREGLRHRVVDLATGVEVVAERLLQPDADRLAGETDLVKPFDCRFEQRRRGREVDRQAAGDIADFVRQWLERGRVRQVGRLIE